MNRTEIARGGTPCAASGYGLARVILILASDEASVINGADFAGGESSMPASFVMSASQLRTALHIILEVHDDGTPPLTRYRRVSVSSGAAATQ